MSVHNFHIKHFGYICVVGFVVRTYMNISMHAIAVQLCDNYKIIALVIIIIMYCTV